MKLLRYTSHPGALALGGALLLGGCLSTASLDNDSGSSAEGSGGSPAAAEGPAASPSGPAPVTSGSPSASPPPPRAGAPVASGGSAMAGSSGGILKAPAAAGGGNASPAGVGGGGAGSLPETGGGAAGGAVPDSTLSREQAAQLVAGTAEGCNSFTERAATTCGSYYCNVDEATLTAALEPSGVCGTDQGNAGGAFVCGARPVTVVGACAREVKSANVFASNEELRPLIRDCAFEDPEMAASVTEPCLDCFIDVAACASDNCLFACLAGDSQGCDDCRARNNCERPLFSCSGLPDPF